MGRCQAAEAAIQLVEGANSSKQPPILGIVQFDALGGFVGPDEKLTDPRACPPDLFERQVKLGVS